MNGNGHDVKSIISKIKKCKCGPDIDIVIAVPSVYLELARKHDGKNIYVAAQNCHKSERNYTGEISAVMLDDLNIEWVLLGDCVRRTLFKESDELIGTKADDALCEGLNVIACLVERKEDDKTGKQHETILSQLKAISDRTDDWCGIVLAYQPVWTFKENITTIKVQEMHSLIRGWIRDNVDENAAKNTRIIYAGKVDSYNALELAEQKDIDGFLIGEKSLTKEFLQIINALKKIKKNVACLNDQDKPKG
ncbi:hypothetical protein O3M35_000971 [Rhynocoris fuscipes]|uniref:Triosephosphate isomerase n=1 Tax=Rhynocoris fuscipes TaxID=488301 RepID=A0AAW1DRT1_9HEMI